MRIKLNNILTFVSLGLTALLLILVVRAWYAVNKTANVESGVGATAVGKNLYISSTYNGGDTFIYDESTFNSTWKTEADLTISNILIPASTVDATNYYYTNDINEYGTAIQTDGNFKFNLITTSKSYYYAEKTVYLCTSEEVDMNCCLRNISIEKGIDETDIYKSVRVAFKYSTNTKIFRGNVDTCYPAVSTTAVSNTDPSLQSGGQANGTFSFPIVGAETVDDVTTYTVTAVSVLIWVEGQDPNAIATYAGTGFKVNMSFQTY